MAPSQTDTGAYAADGKQCIENTECGWNYGVPHGETNTDLLYQFRHFPYVDATLGFQAIIYPADDERVAFSFLLRSSCDTQ